MAADDNELHPGTVVASNYRVVRPLTEGGFGQVFIGENTTLQQKVVIKRLKDGVRGAAAEEAKMMASLNHPNVVHVYAYDEKLDCLVMEHLDGQPLVDYATLKGSQFGLLEAIRACEEVAVALKAIHGAGLVHRDVKPENVMVGEGLEWVKVIDLGTALRVGRTVSPPAGTAEFCPPEQFDGSVPAQPANDTYALGVMLYNLITRRLPFAGTPEEVMKQHYYTAPPSLYETFKEGRVLEPEVDFVLEKVSDLVGELMEKDAGKRPDARSVASLLSSLESRFANSSTQVGAAPRGPIVLTQLPADGGVKRTSTTVLPKRAPGMVAPSTSEALVAMQKKPKQGRRVVWALLLLLLLLGGALALLPGKEAAVAPAPEKPPERVVAEAVEAPPEPALEDEELPPLAKVTSPEPKPGVKVETGAKAPALVVTRRPESKVEVTRAPPCTFDDRYLGYARRHRADMLRMEKKDAAAFSKADDTLTDALVEKDCRRANSALEDMGRLVVIDE